MKRRARKGRRRAQAKGNDVHIACLDLEGTLAPEIWIEFAHESGIEELTRTTRDEPDYAKLMDWRLGVLREHKMKLADIQAVISRIEPLEGAMDFIAQMRRFTQLIIISDTFEQFASPIMEKMGWPTIFCNTLQVGADGSIEGYTLRAGNMKVNTVGALQQMGYDTIAAGDSHNDLGMLRASKEGFLFRAPEAIRAENPDLEAFDDYDDLLAAFKRACA